ncbi:hypothetical protein ABZP36_007879 [Zizania latifolia]
MSGISLAVAPRSDQDHAAERQPSAMLGGVMGSLRVIELQLVAFIMVFSASGLVPLIDLAFPVATTIYLLLLSRLAFPSLHAKLSPSSTAASHEIFRGSMLFQAYVVLGTMVGLFLPLAHVLGGFARGDDGAVRGISRSATVQEATWVWFGRYLAVANLLYFSTNLFVFLIPKFLPRAFDKYFRMRDEAYAKTAEDRPAKEQPAVTGHVTVDEDAAGTAAAAARSEESKKAD